MTERGAYDAPRKTTDHLGEPVNPLTDLIPARYRKYLYALAFVASFVYAVYEANGHDWQRTVGALVTAVLAALAHSNTNPAD